MRPIISTFGSGRNFAKFERIVDQTEYLPGEEPVVQIPPNVNVWKLAKLLDEEPMELLAILQQDTDEIVTDEFQILS